MADSVPNNDYNLPGLPVTGWEIYRSPEFRAFCERFGIAWGLPTRSITLTLTPDAMFVEQEYVSRTDVEPPCYPDHEVGRLFP